MESYNDPGSRDNMNRLNQELSEIHNMMYESFEMLLKQDEIALCTFVNSHKDYV